MDKKDERKKKFEDDEYSILNKGGYGEESMLKWKSFHKNLDMTTVKSYNLDGILRDDTCLSKRNNEHLNINDQKSKCVDERRPSGRGREFIFDDMSVLKESNISLKRYMDSIKADGAIFKETDEEMIDKKKDTSMIKTQMSKLSEKIDQEGSKINQDNVRSKIHESRCNMTIEKENTINSTHVSKNNTHVSKFSPIREGNVTINKRHPSKWNSTIWEEKFPIKQNNSMGSSSKSDKRKILNEISQVKDDLAKCTNLLKKKGLMNNKQNHNDSSQVPIHSDSNLNVENTDILNESLKKRKSSDEITSKRQKDESDFLGNINDFHSSIVDTKKRIDEAIQETRNTPNIQESKEETNDLFIKKIEEHIKREENYRKEILDLEKTVKLQCLEIAKLKSTINSVRESQMSKQSNENRIEEGLNILKALNKGLEEYDEERSRALEDKKQLEQEVVSLKNIINKLVDKIRKLKNKNCN